MNYRKLYKKHFCIDFSNDYVVHHMDFDRANNDISNLLLLPKELHASYHMILNVISGYNPICGCEKGLINIALSNTVITDYGFNMLEKLPDVIRDCHKWIYWKREKYSPDMEWVIFKDHKKRCIGYEIGVYKGGSN